MGPEIQKKKGFVGTKSDVTPLHGNLLAPLHKRVPTRKAGEQNTREQPQLNTHIRGVGEASAPAGQHRGGQRG